LKPHRVSWAAPRDVAFPHKTQHFQIMPPSEHFDRQEFRNALRQTANRAAIGLIDPQIDQLEAYYRLLQHWNKKINLTALPLDAAGEEAIERLLVEPIAAAQHFSSQGIRWVDLGSGGGSPAIPLKIMRPAAALTMIEARSRKVAFLREVTRQLALSHTTVMNERIEELPGKMEDNALFEVITVRAVRPEGRLFEVCRALLRKGGQLMMFQSSGAEFIGPVAGFQLETVAPLIQGSNSQLSIYRLV